MAAHVTIGIKTSPQNVDWRTLDEAWARIGEHDVFESVWMNDHLTDMSSSAHGASLETLTTMATLVHRVPGRWVGHGVLSNTFRHPAVLAKAATVLDHATGGRFVVGLGAGWHEGEHVPFGIPLPPLPEATNEPAPPPGGGPRIYLGGQRRRGIALAAAVADGWLQPARSGSGDVTDLEYFSDRREALLLALEDAGRDPASFQMGAQVGTGTTPAERRQGLAEAKEAVERGATLVILGMPASLGAAGVDDVAREVAIPLRAAIG